MGILDEVDMELLLNAVRRQETSTNAPDPDAPLLDPMAAKSKRAGAVGPYQIVPHPATEPGYKISSIFDIAREMGFDVETEDDATAEMLAKDPEISREYARRYLTGMYDHFGSVDEALGAYNVGPGAMEEILGGIRSMPRETGNYIPSVRRWYEESGKTYPLGYVPAPPTRPTSKFAPRRVPMPQMRPAGLLEGY